jgi:16S rRNA (cytosine967-C5)-methyltransferase
MSARETAFTALMAVRQQDGWSNGVLKEYIARDGLDRREAALATRLVYGVLQNRQKLDFYLAQLLTGKVKDLHPGVRDILQLGLYQLYEMDKIPASAAVNESVALAKKYLKKQKYAPGLVNAVLRKADRERDSLIQPKSYVDKYSHPQVLVDLLKENVGKEHLEAMLAANNAMPATTIQVNTLKTDVDTLQKRLREEGAEAAPHGWMKDCLVLSGTGNLEKLPSFREGLFYVQDPAAKLSVLCAELEPGSTVLDCCAAPGGKSFAAAMQMRGRGQIISCDVHSHKVGLLGNGAQRLGIDIITPRLQDATEFVPQWENAMDAVICDVPCSGYGIIRKKPDIREKDPDTMLGLPALQKQILHNQARYVKPGGVLLYSTCTLLRRENEAVVASFLAENDRFYLEKLDLPANFPGNTTGMLTLVPGEYDTDGFFIARLRRKA